MSSEDGWLRPLRKRGDTAGYVDRLKGDGNWPPHSSPIPRDKEHPTTTPYLIVPTATGDIGVRPVPDSQALYASGVQLLDASGNPAPVAVAGKTYTLHGTVANRGAAASYCGLAEFYIGSAQDFDRVAAGSQAPMRPKGYASFSALPGATVPIACPMTWTPATAAEAQSSVLVQAYDLGLDHVTAPFDARRDRHVGRRDAIQDFTGTWDGTELGTAADGGAPPTWLIRMVVTQVGPNVTVAIYQQLSGAIPSTPQDTGSGTVVEGAVQFVTTETIGPQNTPFTENTWVLNLVDPHTLTFQHHKHYLAPGDTRPDMSTTGMLHRP